MLRWYQTKLAKQPILTASVTSAVLFGCGDILAQQAVDRKGFDKHDMARTGRMALYGGGEFLDTEYEHPSSSSLSRKSLSLIRISSDLWTGRDHMVRLPSTKRRSEEPQSYDSCARYRRPRPLYPYPPDLFPDINGNHGRHGPHREMAYQLPSQLQGEPHYLASSSGHQLLNCASRVSGLGSQRGQLRLELHIEFDQQRREIISLRFGALRVRIPLSVQLAFIFCVLDFPRQAQQYLLMILTMFGLWDWLL